MSKSEFPRDLQHGDENPPQRAPVPPERAQSAYGLIREFFVDVLGSLIPGMLFTLVALALVIASGTCFLRAFGPQGEAMPALDVLLRSQIDASRAWLLLIVAYVVGGIFHRQDPKRPDQKSLERILRGSPESDLKRSAVQKIASWQPEPSWYWLTRRWLLEVLDWIAGLLDNRQSDKKVGRVEAAIIAASPGAQFPYSHIREYLEARGLSRLAKIVPWKGEKAWTIAPRCSSTSSRSGSSWPRPTSAVRLSETRRTFA